MELFKFYPAVPPNGKSNPGSTLVEYDGVKVWFSFTYEVVLLPDGRLYPRTDDELIAVHDLAIRYAQVHIKAHIDNKIVIAPECFYRAPEDQRPADEQPKQNRSDFDNQDSNHMFVNQGYKIKRMVDEGKVSYVIAFKMAGGKESQFPATISNENFLKMLVKALMDAGYKPQEWASGEVQYIDIEFGVKKSQKTAPNGKQFNDYQYFKVKQPASTDIPF